MTDETREGHVTEAGMGHRGGQYPIGVVSRLTGIAAGTLRMWERRYAVAEPSRGEKQNRQYSQQDVERLTLMKRLVDKGHAPSTVAKLPTDEMEKLLLSTEVLAGRSVTPKSVKPELIVVGQDGAAFARNCPNSLTIKDVWENPIAVDTGSIHASADIILFKTATIQPDMVRLLADIVSKTEAKGGIVVFRIATKSTLRSLETNGIVCLREPVSDEQIVRQCYDACSGGKTDIVGFADMVSTERLFTYDQLHKLASMSPAIKCECPQHLADLINSLNAFEKYSEECLETNPDDAAVHEDLRVSSAQSRAVLEQALRRLLKAENISVE